MIVQWYELLSLACSFGGFYGAYGVAAQTRLRACKPLFYFLAFVFLLNFLLLLKGAQRWMLYSHDAVNCLSALTLFCYAVSVKRYWRRVEQTTI